jgi:hypothetical protein
VTDLKQIEWRIKGQKLTKEKVVEYMSFAEGREALKKAISEDKVKQFFPLQTAQISENNYVDFLINKFRQDETFNQIFK